MRVWGISRAAIYSSAAICIIYSAIFYFSVSAKVLLGLLIAPGLSLGIAFILFGIASAIGLTWLFVNGPTPSTDA